MSLFIFAIFCPSITHSVVSSSIMTDFRFFPPTCRSNATRISGKLITGNISRSHKHGEEAKFRVILIKGKPLKYKPQLKVNILFMAWLFQLKSTKKRTEQGEKRNEKTFLSSFLLSLLLNKHRNRYHQQEEDEEKDLKESSFRSFIHAGWMREIKVKPTK